MNRRVIPELADWDEMRAAFRWTIPERLNIAERCCDSWAKVEPDRKAVIHVHEGGTTRSWTYGELKRASDALAQSFRARGVGRGDRVAVLLAQCPEVLVAHFAAMKLGAVVLPLFTLFGEDALRYRLDDSGARIVVTDHDNLDKVLALRPDLPELREVYVTGEVSPPVRSLPAEIAAASGGFKPQATFADDPAVMIYTSGTTGTPKGVLHAHRFLLGHLPSIECTHPGFGQAGDTGWTPADWAWIGGLMDLAMPCLYYGVPLISHRMRRFDADAAFALIGRHGARNLFLPPTALKLMRGATVPDAVDVRSITSGGESLGADLLDWGLGTLGAPINEIYGQTECNLAVASCHGLMPVRPGAMGRAVPGFDVAIRTADGHEVAAGELGEICVRAPNPAIFLRYWNKPDQTAAKLVDGWLKTGDLGRCDDEGYLTYVSRDDDVITSAGYRIGPSEIENCLTGHPDVVMAAVVGVPDPVRTEVVKAFVVLRDGVVWPEMQPELIQRVRDRISPHVAPRMIEQVSDLPMTATGKIMRRELRNR